MEISPTTEKRLRKGFKLFNRFMVLLFRLGLGAYGNGNPYTGWIMIMKHRGRRTGMTRLTPVNYAEVRGDIYCTAGFGRMSDWYQNIRETPRVEVWLTNGRYEGIAEDASNDPYRIYLLRQVLIASGPAAPIFGVDPRKLTDVQVEKLLEHYALVRIRRTVALTGPGGPGDLAWFWPLATFALTLLCLVQNRKR